jgi:Rrf2 family cysteine metabolism transcriptional repressor
MLSTRGRYGLQAMFRLAQQADTKPKPLKEIAEAEGLPEAYLEQLMAPLRKAGLVRSVRGPQGGYTLAKRPHEIRVWDVVAALEGEPHFAQCDAPADPEHEAVCLDHLLWREVDEELRRLLQAVTLRDLVERAEMRRAAIHPIYYI